MYCKNMSKALNGKIRCKKRKGYIDYRTDCQNCSDFILKRNKPINKVSKKRIFVKKEIYEEVYKRDKGKCRLMNKECEGKIELHHVRYRSERKDLINEPNNCVCLCTFHHKLAHSNKKKYDII